MFYLFFSFFKIGLFTFGGGYAMIPLVTELATKTYGLGDELVMNLIAICESTPGPIAINMATFLGYNQFGILGAAVATLGVVLPSFLIILVIAYLSAKLYELAGFDRVLKGIRPVVVGLILATGITMFLSVVLSLKTFGSDIVFNYKSLIVFGIIASCYILVKKIFKKTLSPILLIIISAVLGIILFGVL